MTPLATRKAVGRHDLPARDSTVNVTAGPFRWVVLAGLQTWVNRGDAPNWANLDHDPHAVLVKSNPLRRVYRVSWGGVDFYAKTYQPLTVVRQVRWWLTQNPAALEFERLQVARVRGVAAPRPLAWAVGRLPNRPVAILLTESLGATRSLEDMLYQKNPPLDEEELSRALGSAGRLLARLHCAGIFHRDLHPGNVLLPQPLAEEAVACVTDLQNARFRQRSGYASAEPDRHDRRSNAAILVAALHHLVEPAQVEEFLAAYLQAMRPHVKLAEGYLRQYARSVEVLADRHDRRIQASQDRRARRTSRYAAQIQPHTEWSGPVFLKRKHALDYSEASRHQFSPDQWAYALADPAALTVPGELIKQGRRNSVLGHSCQVGEVRLEVVAKHTRRRQGWRGFLDNFLPSRARRQWCRAHALLNRHLPTALPLAALDHRSVRWRLDESLFLAEKIPGAATLYDYLVGGRAASAAGRRRLAVELGVLLADLRRVGFVHRDCKCTNILVQDGDGGEVRLFLVDLDGVSRRRLPVGWSRHEAVIRLGASLLPSGAFSGADGARFLRAYLGRLGAPEAGDRGARHHLARRLAREIEYKAHRQRSFRMPV